MVCWFLDVRFTFLCDSVEMCAGLLDSGHKFPCGLFQKDNDESDIVIFAASLDRVTILGGLRVYFGARLEPLSSLWRAGVILMGAFGLPGQQNQFSDIF